MHSCFSFVPGREAAFINPQNPQRRRGGASKQTGILINTSPSKPPPRHPPPPNFKHSLINLLRHAHSGSSCPRRYRRASSDVSDPVGRLQTASESFWLHIFLMIFPEGLPSRKCDMLALCRFRRLGVCVCVHVHVPVHARSFS